MKYGTLKGIMLGTKRILRCNPFGGYGYDPVPEKKHIIKKKWYNEGGDIMKNKLIDNVSFAVLIVTLLLVAVFRENGKVILFIASAGLVLYGSCACLQKQRYGTLLVGCGVSLLITMFLYVFEILDKSNSITFMICLSCFIIAFLSLIFMLINQKEAIKRYSLVVEGKVIDLERNPNTKKEYYRPIYNYVIKNMVYTVEYPYFLQKGLPKIGDKSKIYVDPNEPGEVYFDRKILGKLYSYGTCGVLMLVSAIIIFTLFY